ncbi:unnamed protein product [Rotaria sp. Silwood1]|nr:unnamed protein product [Rotaria sp. Silwood1]
MSNFDINKDHLLSRIGLKNLLYIYPLFANSFIDNYLKPILSTNTQWTFDFIDRDDNSSAQYEEKYHWHVYKEVGDEISRVRNNDNTYRNSNKYRYRTKSQQKFYTYFTLYGKSLTSRDVKDNQLQIVLPATHSANMDRADSASNYLEIDYFATMTEIIHIGNIVDVFNEKKKSMEELLNNSPLTSDVWEKTMLLINCPMISLSAAINNGDELPHHERMADLNKYLYSNLQLHPIHPIGLMNAKQLITRGVSKDFSLSLYETLQLNDVMQNLSTNRKENGVEVNSIPTLKHYFEPDWIIEQTKYNNYSRLVRNQFHSLIDNKENTIIDSIVTSLKPISSKDIHYPETKPTSFINHC